MPIHRVNFGAAVLAAFFSIACGPTKSTPRNDSSSVATPAKTDAPDPSIAAADRGRVAGDSAAKTWVIIASDFQCPFCRQWHAETYKAFVEEYVRTGKIKVAFVNFPLGQHQNAVPTAVAAMCASAQNRFWQYHDALFQTQDQWAKMPNPRPLLDSISKTVALDTAEWGRCVDSNRMVPLVLADRDRVAASGVQSTPTFIIGNQILAGAYPLDSMRPAIEAALAKSGSSPSR